MRIGTIYRASNQPEKQNPSLLEVDGCPNFYYHTAMQGKSKIQFQRGIRVHAFHRQERREQAQYT